MPKKNITNAMNSADGRLFALMNTNGGNIIRSIAFAISQL
jgi:hypothetical protein